MKGRSLRGLAKRYGVTGLTILANGKRVNVTVKANSQMKTGRFKRVCGKMTGN